MAPAIFFGLSPAVAGIWSVNQQVGVLDLSSFSLFNLYLYPSNNTKHDHLKNCDRCDLSDRKFIVSNVSSKTGKDRTTDPGGGVYLQYIIQKKRNEHRYFKITIGNTPCILKEKIK